jgi:CBS domain-containing protein
MKTKDIMREAVLVDINSTLKWVVEKMSKYDVNSVLVVDDNGKLIWSVDIVTLMKKIVPEYIGSRETSVAGFTTEGIFEGFIDDNKNIKVKYFMLETTKTIKEDASILKTCMIATEGRQTKIPVINDDNEPVWVITRRWVRNFLAHKMWF